MRVTLVKPSISGTRTILALWKEVENPRGSRAAAEAPAGEGPEGAGAEAGLETLER
ncbi:hypothetical protein [Endothiovibrio diazotrophicus]